MFGLSTVAFEAICAGVVALGLFVGGMVTDHKIGADALDKLKAQYAQQLATATAQAAAEQKRNDDAALAVAQSQALAQDKIATSIKGVLASVPVHVTVKVMPCISYGFIRVLDAAILGVSPESLSLPPGKSDDTCSALTAPIVAAAIIANYGTARANAEQLNALIALLRQELK